MYDSQKYGPETIDVEMTGTMIGFSTLFAAFALKVQPRNLLLFSCHAFNVAAQTNQLRRAIEYKLANQPNAREEITEASKKVGVGAVVTAGFIAAIPGIRNVLGAPGVPQAVKSALAGPAGPLTVFFWAPMSKWAISWNNVKDLDKPLEKISVSQMAALTVTGLIWTRFSFVIAPVNYNMAVVQAVCAGTSAWHLTRKLKADGL